MSIRGLAFGSLRTGKKYRLINYGDRYDFELEDILPDGDFMVKDLHTLERFRLKDTIRFGKGRDFEIREIDG
ncbi:MAG: hypothetical protein K1X47_12285 [Cyclobacteriaceae bacterium]|nr:hypothetical protein [Cyclobacteriaceae bacterium]